MASDTNNSLTEDQMQVDFRSDPTYILGALREVVDLEARLKDRGDDEEITVPVATMNRMAVAMHALVKIQTEFGRGLFGGGNQAFLGDRTNRGDRGASCDYNPFSKVDFGDL